MALIYDCTVPIKEKITGEGVGNYAIKVAQGEFFTLNRAYCTYENCQLNAADGDPMELYSVTDGGQWRRIANLSAERNSVSNYSIITSCDYRLETNPGNHRPISITGLLSVPVDGAALGPLMKTADYFSARVEPGKPFIGLKLGGNRKSKMVLESVELLQKTPGSVVKVYSEAREPVRGERGRVTHLRRELTFFADGGPKGIDICDLCSDCSSFELSIDGVRGELIEISGRILETA